MGSDVEVLDTLLLIAGALLLILDVFAEVIRRLWLSVPLIALAAGVLLGPEVLGIVAPEELGDAKKIMEGLARMTLALAVIDIALRFDRSTLDSLWRTSLRLVFGGMLGMWLLAGLGAWLLLDVPFWVGMLIGAILTPTDPVVAATLTSEAIAKAHLPVRLRRLLQFESGANDGVAIVIFLLPALVLSEPSGEFAHWLGKAAREVGIAIAGGLVLGAIAALLTNRSLRYKATREPLLVGVTVGLALITLGGAHILEGSGVLAAFVGGLCFAVVLDDEARDRLDELHQTVANLLVPLTFAFFGMVLPFGAWEQLGVAGILFAGWVLLVRRPPVVPVVLAGSAVSRRERAFMSWFGPLGVAAMYYMTLIETYDIPHKATIFAAASLAVVASVVAHSTTATPGVRRYARRSMIEPLRHPLDAARRTP